MKNQIRELYLNKSLDRIFQEIHVLGPNMVAHLIKKKSLFDSIYFYINKDTKLSNYKV